jgi:hypothetical protein
MFCNARVYCAAAGGDESSLSVDAAGAAELMDDRSITLLQVE